MFTHSLSLILVLKCTFSLSISIYLFLYLSLFISISFYIYLFLVLKYTFSLSLSDYLSVYFSIYLFLYLFLFLYIFVFTFLYLSLSFFPSNILVFLSLTNIQSISISKVGTSHTPFLVPSFSSLSLTHVHLFSLPHQSSLSVHTYVCTPHTYIRVYGWLCVCDPFHHLGSGWISLTTFFNQDFLYFFKRHVYV